MTGALIILAVTVAVGVLLYLTRGKSESPSIAEPTENESAVEEEAAEVCCGRHAVCEKGLLRPEELYYDDEELDRFASREPDSYDAEEVEAFREVLYTLKPEEVYEWGVALTQRNVALPLELRDEWVMMCEK